MISYKCDRCGKQGKSPTHPNKICDEFVDLCPECESELREEQQALEMFTNDTLETWLENGKKVSAWWAK